MSALDPYYLVKDEIEDLVAETQGILRQWDQLPEISRERVALTKKLFTSCDNIKWQLDELDKAIGAAERDPQRFSMNLIEVQRRKAWTLATQTQVGNIRRRVQSYDDAMRIPNAIPIMPLKGQIRATSSPPKNRYHEENEEYIKGEQVRQSQLIKDQDQDLDDLSKSMDGIGEVGLAIHTELGSQDLLLGDLGRDVDTTSNRLEYAQKKLELLMKKAGAKGQIVLIAFLLSLLAILILLTFYT